MGKSIIAYLALVIMTSAFFSLTLMKSYEAHGRYFMAIAGILVLVVIFFEEGGEFIAAVLKREKTNGWQRRDAYNFLTVVSAALITFFLSIDTGLGLGPVVAASLVGIVAALINPAYAVPAFCGSFVGMACGDIFTLTSLLLAAALAAMAYVLSEGIFNGFGGKLGTIAFFGSVAAALFSRHGFATAALPDRQLAHSLVLIAILAALVTYVLSVRLKLDVVLSSALVGLFAGIIFPVLDPEHGLTMAAMAFCASFVGMSMRIRIVNEAYVALAGLVSAVVFIYSISLLGGAGGKLGTIAFGAAIFVFGIRKKINSASRRVLPDNLLLYPVIRLDNCTQCGQCAAVCPSGVIAKEVDPFVSLNTVRCTGCLKCIAVCRKDAIKMRFGRRNVQPRQYGSDANAREWQ